MADIARFGISLGRDLLEKFDRRIRARKYANRSEAIRDLIREDLVRSEWAGKGVVAGAITLIYDHHKRELVSMLMEIQHDFGGIIISTQHIHLDHDNCMEIVAVKGSPQRVQELSDCLRSIKGVKHGTLSLSTTGRNI